MRIYEYYYKVHGCSAESTTDKECKCWHEEGTGVFPNERYEHEDTRVKWRIKYK